MYKLNVNKEDIRKFDKEALICELGFYIGTKKEIDEYIKKNILGIEHNADEYFVFYMFCKFVVEKFFDSGVQDIYELIDYNYIRLVGMFLNEKCEVVDNILNKVDKLVENKKSNDENIKNQCLEDIKNCYGKVEKYFERYDECMKAIKTCFDNKSEEEYIKSLNLSKEDLFVVAQCFADMIVNNVDYKDDNIGESFYNWCEGGNTFYNMYGNWATEHLTENEKIEAQRRTKLMKVFCKYADNVTDFFLRVYNLL